ncbi:hypothetical protein ASG67_02815 [Sphingomonas sp. Leaf339]|uniref:hypothetical protein n=1 Tax=Sphingomonas sp. Leaf339 TaxID=1736343 RepID=UPI00070227B9|nr:hypothetical protein [Sphingomonas sp. Leaf339]KQU62083.1 hypothetical protein ASG67_02815 [Sphingomonas sp. Leaf339]
MRLIAPLALPLVLASYLVTERHFAAAPRTCAVLQTAYTAAIGARTPAYPVDVRMKRTPNGSTGIISGDGTNLGLTPRDSRDLVARQDIYRDPSFDPHCVWKGSAGPVVDEEGHATYTTFSSPIFSSNGTFALVELSTREAGNFGYGMMCIVRPKHDRWTARCQRSWIT